MTKHLKQIKKQWRAGKYDNSLDYKDYHFNHKLSDYIFDANETVNWNKEEVKNYNKIADTYKELYDDTTEKLFLNFRDDTIIAIVADYWFFKKQSIVICDYVIHKYLNDNELKTNKTDHINYILEHVESVANLINTVNTC